MNLRLLSVIGIGLMLCFSLFARGTGEKSGGAEDNRLRFILSGEPDTLDPQKTTGTLTFQVTRSLYDTLVEPDPAGNILPALAREWQFSEDNLRLTFKLRDDVYFHHGKQFSAEDVVATFLRIIERGSESPHAMDFNYIETVEAVGQFEVAITLKEVYTPILTVLASGWAAILPSDLIGAEHNFSAEPVGTGPFAFQEWQLRQKISLDANTAYTVKEAPRLAGIDFLFITDPALKVQAIEQGDVDGIDFIVDPELSRLRKNNDVLIQTEVTGLVLVLAMNTKHGILRDVAVRNAIAAILEKDAVLEKAYGGGTEINTFMDSSNTYYPDDMELSQEMSREQAMEILSSHTDIKPLRIIAPQNFDPHVRAAQIYHDMLSKVGIPVVIELYEWGRWLDSVFRGKDFEFTVIGHTGKLDPDARLSLFSTPDNYVQWGGDAVKTLLHAARGESAFTVRKSYYTQILQMMAKENPFVYIGTPNRYIALRKEVDGVYFQSQLETYDFRQAYKK